MKLAILIILSFFALYQCAVPTCANYCTTVLANCPLTYADNASCLAVCANLTLGTDDTVTAGNTVGCRIYHADAAAGSAANAATHCPHASLSGGTVCGELCDIYCELMGKACVGNNNPFTSTNPCNNTCRYYSTTGNYTTTGGANLYCKIYHASAALGSTTAANTHCPHASPSGNGACGTKCENLCTVGPKTCNGTNSQSTDEATCLAHCASLPDGQINDVGGNTKDCRIYHTLVGGTSTANAGVHCPHGTHSGGNVCGTWCDVYCQLAQQYCNGTNKIYDTPQLCMTACNGLNSTGAPGATAGDTLQCRIYHLAVASTSSANAVTHCPHASQSGGGVCGTAAPATTTTDAFTFVVSTLMLVAVLLF